MRRAVILRIPRVIGQSFDRVVSQLKINYYGIVVQSTGEDWELGKLTLSTAQLTRAGELPELLQEKLSFRDHSG
ncbi:uncharacterized protein DEA37_0000805 [Paragonimus westermani]|uniref:DUF4139 domain-containing protein n=1 Tax=Paragonimus westermani TaxID=34504 RepID=A0A5J4P2J5_9TREM|nr:uncharacterized protein DEA37_0000805 [Paragonimus westermani]